MFLFIQFLTVITFSSPYYVLLWTSVLPRVYSLILFLRHFYLRCFLVTQGHGFTLESLPSPWAVRQVTRRTTEIVSTCLVRGLFVNNYSPRGPVRQDVMLRPRLPSTRESSFDSHVRGVVFCHRVEVHHLDESEVTWCGKVAKGCVHVFYFTSVLLLTTCFCG